MSFWDDFSGKSQRKDLAAADARASAALAQGYGDANRYYDQAHDAFSPYAQTGQADQNTYRQAIGLGTPDERSAAQSRYFDDPTFQRITSDQQNAMMRNLNARGLSGSGLAARAGSQIAYDNYGGWLDRLKGLGDQGFQATSAQSGIRAGQGDLAYGYGATRAGNAINYGNAMASSRGVLTNNLMGVAGLGINAMAKAYGAGAGGK